MYRNETDKEALCTKLKIKLTRRILEVKENFYFNTVIRIAFEIFLDVGFSCVYNIYNMRWQNGVDIYSNIVSLIWVTLFLFLISSIPVLYYFTDKINAEAGRFKILFEDFKTTKKIYMLDHLVFLLKRTVLILVIVFQWNHGLDQSIYFLVTWIWVLIWKIIIRPFEKTVLNIQDIIFELIMTVILSIYITFDNKSTELSESGRTHVLGVIWVVLMVSVIIINLIVTFLTWVIKDKKENVGILELFLSINNFVLKF